MTDRAAVPNVLLLCSGVPQRATGGGIITRDLCRHYPREHLCYLALTDPSEESTEQRRLGFPLRCLADPCRSVKPRRWNRWARLATGPFRRQLLSRRLKAGLAAAEHFARQQHVDLVWAILDCPSSILLARPLASALGVPLVVSVWDPPEYLADDARLEPLTRRRIVREFGRTLRAAARRAVISEAMREEYQRRYGIDAIVHRHGISDDLRHPPSQAPAAADRLIIGVAGNLYARQEWNALLAALSAHNWRIGGRRVIVRVMSSGLQADVNGPARIEYLGWRSPEETISLLADTDVGYLPYWFDERYRLSVRLCFPTKLCSYLAAGIPVWFHGPEDSSVTRFFRTYPAGVCCHSLEPDVIAASLDRLATDGVLYTSAVAAGQAALDRELNHATFVNRFAALLGIDPQRLQPSPAAVQTLSATPHPVLPIEATC